MVPLGPGTIPPHTLDSRSRRRWVRYGLLAGVVTLVWMIPAVVCVLQVYSLRFFEGGPAFSWAGIWWYVVPPWLVRVPVTLLVLWLAHRVRLDGPPRGRSLLVHLAACVALSLASLGFFAFWTGITAPFDVSGVTWTAQILDLIAGAWLHFAVLAYWGTVGAYYAYDYSRKLRDRALRASRLEAQLSEAQLHALQMQLHPHFLFNTLNAISTLVLKRETAQAGRMINRLADFLRMTLEQRGEQEVPLGEELAFTEQYLAIEQCRLQERLSVRVEVDPAARLALVPSLLLQPLVENAVRHGIAPHEGAGRLVLAAHRRGDRLCVRVEDDGPGLPSDREPGGGIGLANTQARLEQRYGAAHRFALDGSPLGGLRVTVELPYRTRPISGDGSLHPAPGAASVP
ncbi:sensor histidine kinase [Rubrivirga sp.]|uniref:sensor histidine kinase n=1 Tax=Rubrivirga sp. TaxID=1885344 RepID=UPI003B52D3DE